MRWSQRLSLSAVFCSTLLWLPSRQLAADEPEGGTFTIRSTVVQAGGMLDQTELVTVAISHGRAVATLRQPASSVEKRVAGVIDGGGVLHTESDDLALSCYNSAQGIAGYADHTQGTSLLVQVDGNAVAVPLHIAVGSFDGGVRELIVGGGVAGTLGAQPAVGLSVVVDGTVIVRGNEVLSAQLRETSTLTATNTPVAQATCTLTRTDEQTTARPALSRRLARPSVSRVFQV
jgi:hypothetical protein